MRGIAALLAVVAVTARAERQDLCLERDAHAQAAMVFDPELDDDRDVHPGLQLIPLQLAEKKRLEEKLAAEALDDRQLAETQLAARQLEEAQQHPDEMLTEKHLAERQALDAQLLQTQRTLAKEALNRLETRQLAAREHLEHTLAAKPIADRTWERRCYGGLWSGLNVRGRAFQFEYDFGVAFATRGEPVGFGRYSARFLVLPRFAHAAPHELWGITLGVRASHYLLSSERLVHFRNGNVELPSIGFIAHSPFDRFRFEIDLAPVIGVGGVSQLDGEASLLAALGSGPRDDVLFLPNLRSAGRVRAFLRARFDPFVWFSTALSVAATAGYAELATRVGNISGSAGGVDLAIEFMFPFINREVLQGISFRFALDLGVTSVWPTDVVFPIRTSFSVGFAVTRSLELALTGTVFTRSAPLSGLIEFGTVGLAARFNFGAEPSTVRASVERARQQDASAPPMAE